MEFAVSGIGPAGWGGAFRRASRQNRAAARVAAAVVAGVAAVGGATYYFSQQYGEDGGGTGGASAGAGSDAHAKAAAARSVVAAASALEHSSQTGRATSKRRGARGRAGGRRRPAQHAADARERADAVDADGVHDGDDENGDDVENEDEDWSDRGRAAGAAASEQGQGGSDDGDQASRSGDSGGGGGEAATRSTGLRRDPSMAALNANTESSKKPPVKVDRRFFSGLGKFLRIILPSVRSREALITAGVAATLVARTRLDIWVSDNAGDIVKAIVARDKQAFVQHCIRDISVMMLPMSVVNNLLKLLISELRVQARRRLTAFFHDSYLSDQIFYKATNLDNRIQNIDQLLTQDVERFCTTLVDLYSNVSKPLLDVVLFSSRLSRSLGPKGPIMMIGYFMLTSSVLRKLQPPFGRLTAEEQRLEGEFRLCHSRLITHSEEIAFYGGGQREKIYINGAFERLVRHLHKVFWARFRIGILDSVLVKYLATIVGYCVVSMPLFFTSGFLPAFLAPRGAAVSAQGANAPGGDDAATVAEMYTRNSRLLISLSAAIGRLVLSGKELTRLAGYTARVNELHQVLADLKHNADGAATGAMLRAAQDDAELRAAMTPARLVDDVDYVRFEHINIVSPDRMLLARDLTFDVPRGTNLLITGPNGCGKSSLFRVLNGLWPLYGGTLYRPPSHRMFYVPQRPYLALGSLREQVIYPLTSRDMRERDVSDGDLQKLLADVHLGELSARRGGWNNVCDWADVLSGGEKQRLAMARLFFHRPQYAVLDECTSAVSLDVEGFLYERARELGITLITVSHRPSLWRFHEKVLRLGGQGDWTVRTINAEDVPQVTGANGSAVAA